MTTSTSAITRELFQLKEQIDQLTFKQQRASPLQKDQLKMRLEGLKRTQRGLKHLRTLMLSSTTSTTTSSSSTAPSTQEDNDDKPPAASGVEPQKILPKNEKEEEDEEKKKGVCSSQMQQIVDLTTGKGALLVNQVQRLRWVLYYHLKRYKPLQILKAVVALWVLATFILQT